MKHQPSRAGGSANSNNPIYLAANLRVYVPEQDVRYMDGQLVTFQAVEQLVDGGWVKSLRYGGVTFAPGDPVWYRGPQIGAGVGRILTVNHEPGYKPTIWLDFGGGFQYHALVGCLVPLSEEDARRATAKRRAEAAFIRRSKQRHLRHR